MIEDKWKAHKMCRPFKIRLKMKKRTPTPSTSTEDSSVVLYAPVHVPKQVVRGLLKKVAQRKKDRTNGTTPRS